MRIAKQNGKNVLEFYSGIYHTADVLQNAAFSPGPPYSAFAVFAPDVYSTAVNYPLRVVGPISTSSYDYAEFDGWIASDNVAYGNIFKPDVSYHWWAYGPMTGPYVLNQFYYANLRIANTTGWVGRLNSDPDVSYTETLYNRGTGIRVGCKFGSISPPADTFNGFIGEIFFVCRVPTNTELQQINDYILSTWNITGMH